MSRKNTFDDVVYLAAKLPWWPGMGCYTGRRGLVVSLDRDEVRSMKRVRVEKE